MTIHPGDTMRSSHRTFAAALLTLATHLASATGARAQDWTAMIQQQMSQTDAMLARGQQQVDGIVQQRMQDPAVQAAYRQHLAAAAAQGRPALDYPTFTYQYVYTNGFSAQGMAHARATEAGIQAQQRQAMQGVRDAEGDRAAAMQGQRDSYFRNQKEAGHQLLGNSTYTAANGAQQVLPHTWQANTDHEYQGRRYHVDAAGQYWVASSDGYWYPLAR